jgi:catechol 2,3-dioxygenase-like lactoylglutathione lyase family enzyme
MVNRIIHFNVVCTDLERSLEFYCDKLGGKADRERKEALKKASAERGIDTTPPGIALGLGRSPEWRACMIRFGDDEGATVIDLLQWLKPASYGEPYDRLNHVGIARMALAVDDVDKTYNDLKAKGVEFISPPQVIDLRRGRGPGKIVVCKDPDGIAVEFVERA